MTFKYKSLNLYPPVEGDWLLIRAQNIVINTIGQTCIYGNDVNPMTYCLYQINRMTVYFTALI